ncbi:MAG: ribonuclease HII [Alphaproteobacteria bacterium]|nr:ribonuclease HII [Alphaproteobacteria bacterium]
MPDFTYERTFPAAAGLIAGIDEAGRGPWAGPVVAGAVIFPDLQISASLASKLDDSKKLTAAKREALFEELHASNAFISYGSASVEEIDRLNILQATFLAMRRAVESLPQKPDFALIDGNKVPPNLPCPAQFLIKGDALSLSVAAASIIAKVTRDRLMSELAKEFPYYGWEKNAGYGTKAHQEGLKAHGICVHHRKSYAPIKEYLK